MRWKQFFTPVTSITAAQAQEWTETKSSEELTTLDVRQPNEYRAGHIPGAKLIPLPDLNQRLGEIDSDKPVMVYCAIGGRSRVAAQMLAGIGFKRVYNLSGGFKAWKSKAAIGPEDQGLELFTGTENLPEILVVSYSLETGLRDFYLSMIPKVQSDTAKDLFQKLSDIEVKHQKRIFNEYLKISGKSETREEFETTIVSQAVEGGLTTEEYITLFQPDWDSVIDIIELAMSIEAQALDLYQRAAERSREPRTRQVLTQIADEERSHLAQLGKLIEEV